MLASALCHKMSSYLGGTLFRLNAECAEKQRAAEWEIVFRKWAADERR
jgi:hypothetical protein